MRESFRRFLADSLDAISRDAAGCAGALAAALGPVVIDLVVDRERTVVYRDGDGAVAARRALPRLAAAGRPIVHVETTARALLDLVDGRDELLSAVLANRIRVRAPLRDADRLFDVMRLFVEGNARSRAAPRLFAEYCAHVARESRRSP